MYVYFSFLNTEPTLLMALPRFSYKHELWTWLVVSFPLLFSDFLGCFFFFFPLVVFFLENFYFGRGCGLSHGCALTHVFCNLKPKSEANPNTAVTGNCLVLEMLSTHMHPPARLFCWFFFSLKFFVVVFPLMLLEQEGHAERKEQGESLSYLL